MRSVVRAVSIIVGLSEWADAAVAQHRLAFVVGIDRYRNLPPHSQLERARNDADGVGEAHERAGFEITPLDREAETVRTASSTPSTSARRRSTAATPRCSSSPVTAGVWTAATRVCQH